MAWTRSGDDTATVTNQVQNGQSNTSSSGTSTTNNNQVQNVNQTTTTQSQNMSDASLVALEQLIQQLLNGGTPQMRQQQARRQQEIRANQQLRGSYSKEAAFNDAQGAMAQMLQQAMESSMPALVRAAEGSGTSQNSMRALLTQDALNRASQSASALGLDAAGKYGTIAAAFSGILEALTRPDNSTVEALVNALNVAKGAVTNSTQNIVGTTTTTGSSTTNTNNQSQTNTQGQSSTQQPKMTDLYGQVSGAQSLIPTGVSSRETSYYSPSAWENVTPQQLAESLQPSVWSDYSF
jgi:hypothetical protein